MCINSSWNSWNQVGDLFCLWARRVEAKFSSSMTVRAMALSSGKRWWVWFMSHWQTNTTSGQGMYQSLWDESDSERSDLYCLYYLYCLYCYITYLLYCTVAHHICFSSQWWALIAVWLPLQEMALVLWFSKPLVLREGLSSHLTCCLATHSSGSFGFLTKNWSSKAAVEINAVISEVVSLHILKLRKQELPYLRLVISVCFISGCVFSFNILDSKKQSK